MFPARRRLYASLAVSRRWLSTSFPRLKGQDEIVKPWYVEEARKVTDEQAFTKEAPLPELPESSPPSLKAILEFVSREAGLKDVAILDKRSDEEFLSSALGPAIIVLGTGNSMRHLGSAGSILMSWLKHQFGVYAGRDGILTSNFLKLQNKRLKRKQQRQSMADTSDSVPQRVGSWVVIDTKVDNIYIHLMTAERRQEVNLEELSMHNLAEEDSPESVYADTEYADPSVSSKTAASATSTGSSAPKPPSGKRNYSTAQGGSAMPASREELALITLVSDKNDTLNEGSREVQDFIEQFPKLPTREDWKKRLRFFAVAAIYSPQFSLQRVVSEAELQQANGFLLDDEDIETVATAICYHGQSHFASLSQDDESTALWQEMCDYKARLWLEFYSFALQPRAHTLLDNPRLLVLVYRTFTALSANSITPLGALETPEATVEDIGVFLDKQRVHPLRIMLQATSEIRNVQTVGMLLTSLVNGKLYDAFWKVVDTATLLSSSRDFSEQVAELVLSLIIKTGDSDQITFAIQTYLPDSIINRDIRLTETLAQAVEHGLSLVDADGSGGFGPVRKFLAKSKDTVSQIA